MIRSLLVAAAQFYVSIAGSDISGDGSAAAPWATFQHASDVIAQTIDTGGQAVTVQGVCTSAPCVWPAGVQLLAPYTGGGIVTFQGDLTTPSNQEIAVTASSPNPAACFQATFPAAQYRIAGFKCTNSAGNGVYSSDGALVLISGDMEWGAIAQSQIEANGGSVISTAADWTVSGGGLRHLYIHNGGSFENATALTVTLAGTPAFTNVVYASVLGVGHVGSMTYSGACTGQRYVALTNAILDTNGGGASYFCGSTSGGTATGGMYQ